MIKKINPREFECDIEMEVKRENLTKKRGKTMIDPQGSDAFQWKKLYLTISIVSLFVDPLFLMVLEASPDELCIQDDASLLSALTAIRSVTDVFYMMNIFLQFQTAYVAPSTRVFGKGDLIFDPCKVSLRYLTFGFWVDLTASLPLPQVYFWGISPNLRGLLGRFELKIELRFIILLQFMLRTVLAYPLSVQIARDTGLMSRKVWLGAAYNFLFFILTCHVSASCWYLLAIERQTSCWRSICKDHKNSTSGSVDCGSVYSSSGCILLRDDKARSEWIKSSNVTRLCADPYYFQFGIYGLAMTTGATSAPFFSRFMFASWWGMQTLCSFGQNLYTSIYIGENVFSMMVVALGLTNYALMIGNMQSYLQSSTRRLEEWRMKRNDMEKWMHHRQLPSDLRRCIRKHFRHKWVATDGVDEDSLLTQLPTYLQRQIKRHLCLALLCRVPLFKDLNDEHILDAICERLTPTLYTQGTLVVSEGDPITEMLFIARGELKSYTTNGGQAGFYNSTSLGPGDFCGDELLTWVLDSPVGPSSMTSSEVLPSSTRTVMAVSDVEAFALGSEGLRYVGVQFCRLHRREVKHKFRVHSHNWRIWAACYIQAAWRRYKRLKAVEEESPRWEMRGSPEANVMFPSTAVYEDMDVFVPRPGSGMEVYAARLMATVRRGSSNRFGPDSYGALNSLL